MCGYDFHNKVDGGWGAFGNWESCPLSCGGSHHSRHRECNNPVPEHGGNDCTADGSSDVEIRRCNENPCPGKQIASRESKKILHRNNLRHVSSNMSYFLFPIFHKVNGGWGEYGDWEKCPHSCGGLSHSRYRECNNPVPQHGGDACTLDGSTNVETKKCNNNPCPGE